MKIVTAVLLFFTLCVNAQKPRVIEHPSYELKRSGITNIDKIVFTDSTTRFYVHTTFIPGWWISYSKDETITDCQNGKAYTVIGIENGAFDQKIKMPKSGDSTVVLIFPALDKSIEKVDFGKSIFGLSLKKNKTKKKAVASMPDDVTKWLNDKLAQKNGQPLEDFNSPSVANRDTAYLIGYIKGYDTRLGFTTGIIYTNNVLTREDYPIVLQIYPDGRFEAKIPLNFPSYSSAYINNQNIPFYIEPGRTLSMILTWDEFLLADRYRNITYQFKDIVYGGPLAKTNSELNGFPKHETNYKEFLKMVNTLSPEAYTVKLNESLGEQLKQLESYTTQNSVSPKACLLLKNQLYIDNASDRFDFVDRRASMAKKDTTNSILQLPVPNNYYDFLKAMPLDDHSLWSIDGFGTFINRFEYCAPFYNSTFNSNVHMSKRSSYELQMWYLKDSVLTNDLHLEPNLTYEVAKIRSIYCVKGMEKNEAYAYWDSLKMKIHDAYLISTGADYLAKTFPENANKAYTLPGGFASEVFRKIIDKYKGKVLFVDFWATTCGPCVAGIKRMQPTREKYKDNPDFEFVFITEERSSPEEAYNKFVNEQGLTNTFRLSQDDFNFLRQLFKFNGIPHYVVIDRNGDVLNDDFEMYNFKSELTKILPDKNYVQK